MNLKISFVLMYNAARYLARYVGECTDKVGKGRATRHRELSLIAEALGWIEPPGLNRVPETEHRHHGEKHQ